jgi:hypothetical protein
VTRHSRFSPGSARVRSRATILLGALAATGLVGCASPAAPSTAARGAAQPARLPAAGPTQTASGTPRWSTGARLPVAVSEVGVAVLGGQVHVVGGYIGGRAHSSTHLVYDVAAGRWRTAAPLPARLDHVAAAAVGTGSSARLLAIGGYGTAGGPTSAVYAYDPRSNTWTTRAPLPVARAAGVAVVAGGKVHYIGGKAPGGDTGEHDVYDPATNRWSTAAPLPTARDHAAAAVVGDVIFVAAGRPGSKRTLESYDLRTGRWTTGLPGLPLGRSSVAAAAWRGRFVVLGGEDSSETTAYRNVDAYDPARRSWTQLPAMPGPRQGIGAVVVGDALLVPGGGPAAGPARQTDTLLELR